MRPAALNAISSWSIVGARASMPISAKLRVEAGQLVKRNEYIARSGRPSSGLPPHLHFGVRITPYNRFDGWGGFSDPLPFLNPSNILLPDQNQEGPNQEGDAEPIFSPHPMAVERPGLRRP